MVTAELKFRHVREQLSLYEQQSESCMLDHEDAVRCRDFEELLAIGIALCDLVHRLDEEWRRQVRSGNLQYDPAADSAIQSLYELWFRPCDKLRATLQQLEDRGFTIEGAREFRQRCDEVRGILTPDEEFFAGDALVSLRDKTIDEHRRGETTDIGGLSD
jgi:hypothetical protein